MKPKTMITTISGIVTLVSLLVFLVSLLSGYPVKVGDRFAHVNPGTSNDPTEPSKPFVWIYTVEEVKDGKVRVLIHMLRADGYTSSWERWETAQSVGRFDTKLPPVGAKP